MEVCLGNVELVLRAFIDQLLVDLDGLLVIFDSLLVIVHILIGERDSRDCVGDGFVFVSLEDRLLDLEGLFEQAQGLFVILAESVGFSHIEYPNGQTEVVDVEFAQDIDAFFEPCNGLRELLQLGVPHAQVVQHMAPDSFFVGRTII